MYKYEEQFRAENPQTIGETDQQFDLSNYKDWLEKKLDAITQNRAGYINLDDKMDLKVVIENNEDTDLETLMHLLM